MLGVAAPRIVDSIRKPRNNADEAIAPKPGWDGAFRAICFVARLANTAWYWLRLASRISSRKATVAATRGFFRGSLASATVLKDLNGFRVVAVAGNVESRLPPVVLETGLGAGRKQSLDGVGLAVAGCPHQRGQVV